MKLDIDFEERSNKNLVRYYRKKLVQILKGEGGADLLPKGVLRNLRQAGILQGKRGALVLSVKGRVLLGLDGVTLKKRSDNIESERHGRKT